MKSLKTLLLNRLSKIHVVHSIPGRLRLKVPGLREIKNQIKQKDILNPYLLSYKLKGIHSVDFNSISSKLLIKYDEKILDERQILNWLNKSRELLLIYLTDKNKQIDEVVINEIIQDLKKAGYELEKQ